jgi:hypothetical protein
VQGLISGRAMPCINEIINLIGQDLPFQTQVNE